MLENKSQIRQFHNICLLFFEVRWVDLLIDKNEISTIDIFLYKQSRKCRYEWILLSDIIELGENFVTPRVPLIDIDFSNLTPFNWHGL